MEEIDPFAEPLDISGLSGERSTDDPDYVVNELELESKLLDIQIFYFLFLCTFSASDRSFDSPGPSKSRRSKVAGGKMRGSVSKGSLN